MHILSRLAVVACLCLALIPLGTFALVSLEERWQTEQELEEALVEAKSHYRVRRSAGMSQSEKDRREEETEQQLTALAQRKRVVRLRLSALLSLIQHLENRADTLILEQERSARLLQREEERLRTFAQYIMRRREIELGTGPRVGGGLLRRFLRGSLGERVSRDARERALFRAREHLIELLLHARASSELSEERLRDLAGDLAQELIALREEHQELQEEYRKTLATRENVEEAIVLSEEELVEVKQTVGEVHEQVLRLQGELARIDARIKRRAERTLIEKGLRTPRPGQYSDGTVVGEGPLFAWPVYGPISAGFLDARYRKVFGVPHHGMDIATPQGTAVRSVADGVVFLVKNGGAKGYTYVLVGHQDGYATLYGHLSSVSVATGEDIVRGQVIGFSGGMRGTPGAGLMTTGPHLHLEVILNGVNLNPATVLP